MLVHFPPFHADLSDERLWCGTEPMHLTRKAWQVLRVLLEAKGRLVTKDQLADTVWQDTHVGDDSLTKVVRELRRALGDDQRAPRFIATVHGRGYRFVASLSNAASVPEQHVAAPRPSAVLIGRERHLSILGDWLDAALHGQRQVVFVTGEVGIGKSSLVTAFIVTAAEDESSPLHIGAGQCVEQYGEAEPFLPVLAALQRLSRTPTAAAILRRAAAAAPWIATACGLAPNGSAGGGAATATHAGVLRTLAEVIEAIAADGPLVLVLEDLHWSDPSTLDLINLLARRADPARLLVLCTLRHTDALAAGHRSALLLRELRRTERCREVILDGLARTDVDRYLGARLQAHPPPTAADYVLRHTGGNPFFMGALVDDLLARGSLREIEDCWELHAEETPAIPPGSLAALAPRLERLSDAERAMLEAASVVGHDFAAETITAVLADESSAGPTLENVEAVCERLVRHQDLLRRGESSAPYCFRHALYRQALYESIAPARRRRMHGLVGKAQVAARPPGSVDGAAEIAEHFARAGDHAKAASYHAEAGYAARARFAEREVVAHFGAARIHLRQSPRTVERDMQELMLAQQHAGAMLAANGFAADDVVTAFRRAKTLSRRLEMPLSDFLASAGLCFFHLMRAELNEAAVLASEMTEVAAGLPLPECTTAAHGAIGAVLFGRGDLIGARQRLGGLRGLFPRVDASTPIDPTVWHLGTLSMLHVALGEVAAARATCSELLANAADGPVSGVANAHMWVALVEAQLHNAPLVLEHVAAATTIAVAHGLPVLLVAAGQLRGWSMAVLGNPAGGMAAWSDGEAEWLASGQRLGLPFFAILRAEICLCGGDRAGAQAAIDAGLAHAESTGEHRQDSDLFRLRAECLRREGRMDEAAATLDTALDIAAAQGARLAELRAAIASFRLRRSTPASAVAHGRLALVAASFDENATLPELTVAEDLLRDGVTALRTDAA